jgi:outer membrane protein assembly factor BamB
MSGASFKGNLEVLNLSDIFQSLAMNRHSGTLIISDGKREKKIFFAEGEIQLLSSSRRMKLGELLIATGKITEEDLDLALKLQKQNRKRLGEILVEEGFCAEEDVARIVKFQIEEEIYDLFLWKKAEFEFIADHIPEDMKRESSNLMRLSLNTNSLIMEALRRLDEWEVVKQAVPSTKEIFVIQDERTLAQIDLPERLKNEIHLIDGKTNVEGLAEKTMISEFELCKLLAELVHQGAIAALPMEKLVQKAEEAYAVNDFAAAANLYGRLAELAPGEPKVLIPLAESLRRNGDDRMALLVFGEIANKLDPTRDGERLRRCYESILALDPERADVARKLEQMDARSARRRTGRTAPMAVVAILLVAVGGIVFHKPIKAYLDKLKNGNSAAVQAKGDEEADKLLTIFLAALNFEHDYKKAFDQGVQIAKNYPKSPARQKVQLPILVRTEPTGFAVTVNGLPQGETKAGAPVVVGSYSSFADKVIVQIRRISKSGGTAILDTEALRQIVLPDPFKWPEGGEVKLVVEETPEFKCTADSPIETTFAYWPTGKAWVNVGREGSVYVLDEKTLDRQKGWGEITIGQFGDVFSPPTLIGSRLYLGLSSGGVAVIDLDNKTVSTPFPIEQGGVPGRPLVCSNLGRLVAATTAGSIYGFPLSGGKPGWRVDVDGPVRFSGALGDEDGTSAVFASADERLRAIDVASGKLLWPKPATVGRAIAAPVRARGFILVANADGELVAVNAKTGVVRQRWRDPDGHTFRFCVDDSGDSVFLASEDGHVRALSASDFGTQLWKPEEWSRPTKIASQIAYLPRVATDSGGSLPDRVIVTFDDARFVGLDAKTGLLAWQGTVNQGVVSLPITVQGDAFLVPAMPSDISIFHRQ